VAAPDVSRFVDFAKGALAEFLHHLVLADFRAALETALEPFGRRRSRGVRHGGGDGGAEESRLGIVDVAVAVAVPVAVLGRRLRKRGVDVASASVSCRQDEASGRRCHRGGRGRSYRRGITIAVAVWPRMRNR
jgi:hypothetical protein